MPSNAPPSSRCCDDQLNPPRQPRSEWKITSASGLRAATALASALAASSVRRWSARANPTTRREAISRTVARNSQPSAVCRSGLRREESRGPLEDPHILPESPVLPAQLAQLLPLARGQPALGTHPVISLGLLDPSRTRSRVRSKSRATGPTERSARWHSSTISAVKSRVRAAKPGLTLAHGLHGGHPAGGRAPHRECPSKWVKPKPVELGHATRLGTASWYCVGSAFALTRKRRPFKSGTRRSELSLRVRDQVRHRRPTASARAAGWRGRRPRPGRRDRSAIPAPPRRCAAAVEQGSQTGPSGQVVAGGRASPQRAQTRSDAGGGLGHGRGG